MSLNRCGQEVEKDGVGTKGPSKYEYTETIPLGAVRHKRTDREDMDLESRSTWVSSTFFF